MEEKLKRIIAIGFVLRFIIYLLAVNNNAFYEPDSDGYATMGNAFAKGDFLFSDEQAKQSSLFRVGGYPTFLGIFYAAGLDDSVVVFAQLLLDLFNIYLIFLLATVMFPKSKSAGFAAALLYSISPLFLSFFFKILTETLFTTVLLGAFYLFLTNRKDYSAALFGILILIKPIAFLFPVFFAVYEYIKTRKVKVAVVFLVIALIVASTWLVRNYLVFNRITYSSIATVNYVCWNGVYLANDVGLDNPQWKDFIAKKRLKSFEDCQQRPFEEIENDVPQITNFIISNPYLYLWQHVKGAMTFFIPTMPNNMLEALGMEEQTISLTYIYLQRGFDIGFVFDYLIKNNAYALLFVISTLYQIVVYLLFVFGIYRLYKEKNYLLFAIIIALIVYNIVAVGPIANYRFRMPVEPFIILIASSAVNLNISFHLGKKWHL